MSKKQTFTLAGKSYTASVQVFSGGLDELADTAQAEGWSVSRDMLGMLRTGDNSLVAKSDAMLDRIEALEHTHVQRGGLDRCVAGSVADIPAYLAGQPVAMRRRAVRVTRAPVTLVLETTTSGGVNAGQIARRGVAALALVRKLQMAGHPVTLWLGSAMSPNNSGHSTMQAVAMDTAPLDLARACWALASADYQRKVTFQSAAGLAGQPHTDTTGWPFEGTYWTDTPAVQAEAYAQLLGVEVSDLIMIPSTYVTMAEHFDADAGAAKWVQDMYAKSTAYAQKHDDAA